MRSAGRRTVLVVRSEHPRGEREHPKRLAFLSKRRAFRRSAGGYFSARAALLTIPFQGPIPAGSRRGVVAQAVPRTAGNQGCEPRLPEPHPAPLNDAS